jgi:uncharacterized protein YggU (UPF0235/DUF167 family)
MRVTVRVTPRAAHDRVGPYEDGVLRVRTTAAPVDGRANVALCALLAKALGVKKRDVRVVTGATARTKVVEIDGVDEADLRAAAGA